MRKCLKWRDVVLSYSRQDRFLTFFWNKVNDDEALSQGPKNSRLAELISRRKNTCTINFSIFFFLLKLIILYWVSKKVFSTWEIGQMKKYFFHEHGTVKVLLHWAIFSATCLATPFATQVAGELHSVTGVVSQLF